MAPPPTPQLARMRFSVDSDSSDNCDSSLEILPPIRASTTTNGLKQELPKILKIEGLSSSDDDSEEDELLKSAPATFSRKHNATAPPRTTTVRTKPAASTNEQKKKREQEEARLQRKRETEQKKQQDKEAKTRKREQDKLDRERKKLADQQTKKRQREENAQATGKFAHQEIVVLMEPEIYNNEEYALVDALSEDFLLHSYSSALTCKKAIQWVRKDHLQGGAKCALERLQKVDREQFEHLHYAIFILGPNDFIQLLQKKDRDDDDYPVLVKWLESLTTRWQYVWNTTKQPRFLFLLHRVPEGLDQMWVDHRRKNTNQESVRLPALFELQDAIQWLLIQFQIECIHCPDIESIQANVFKMTRALCEAPYKSQVTELECIKKIKSNTSADDNLSLARDSWVRMLQQIPRVSVSSLIC